jgi:hypothetical protein
MNSPSLNVNIRCPSKLGGTDGWTYTRNGADVLLVLSSVLSEPTGNLPCVTTRYGESEVIKMSAEGDV